MAGTPEQCPTDAQLVALAAGALEGSELAFARVHLGGCALCAARLADLGGDGGRTLPSPSWGPEVTPTTRGPALPRPIQPGTWIGNYRVDRTVGAGGMGVVYRGVDRSLARAVAIKVLNRPDEDPGRTGDRARLEREWRALARLSHRNVVTIYQVGEHDGRRYLAMEYIEGGTVREWLAAAPRTWREIIDVFVQAGSGLAAVHEAGFIHRDIKPDNLLVGADGRVRLGDFGLVVAAGAGEEGGAALALAGTRRRSARLTDTSALMGTPRYMAPEVLRGEPADARSDQWSFCASVWEALSGAPAYPGDLVTALGRGHEACLPAEPAHPARMPRRLRAPLLRGLSHDPADRWPSMAALNDVLAGGRGRLTRAGAIGLGAASALVLGVVLAVAGDEPSGPDPCASVGDELTVTWNPARRARLAAALAAAPYPEVATRTVDGMLGRYANQWLAARRAACGAARREGIADQAALETVCLEERRAALDATVEALVQAPPARPGQALEAASALPALDDCADATWLASRPGRPTDAQRRGEIAALRASLEAARARLALGRADEADRLARAVLERARALAAAPLVGESLRLAGLTARATGAADALGLLEEALIAAEASGDDVLVARTWIDLLDTARLGPVERDVARWLRHAGAVGERLERLHARAHIATRADLAAAQGALLATRRMLAPAEDRLREALALELTAGPPGPRLLRARQRLGALLIDRGQRTEGDAELARARLLARELVGDDERAFPPER